MYDEKFIRKCFELAIKGEGFTNPNPMVGCVVVKKNEIVGEGYHHSIGSAHAEVLALEQAGRKAEEATLYTNLEPCNHYGKTPPCTEKIIKSKISKVVYSMLDPNPINNGSGIKKLEQSGIKTKGGVLENEAKQLNSVYIKFITEKLPYVTVKIAQSIDGKIATFNGQSKWITGKQARLWVQKFRNKVDAILVGIETVLKDNPQLIPHLSNNEDCKFIFRVILDSKLRTPLDSRIFDKISKFPVIIATSGKADLDRQSLYIKKGAKIIVAGKRKVDIVVLMKELAKIDIAHVMVEGGGEVIASFLKDKMVNEIFWFIAPKIIGGKHSVTSVEGKGISDLNKAIGLGNLDIQKLGRDILIHSLVK